MLVTRKRNLVKNGRAYGTKLPQQQPDVMSKGTKGKEGNMSSLTPLKLDLTFQFKAGPDHRVVEAFETPITPRDLRGGYTQSRHAEARLENQVVNQSMMSTVLPCHPSQTFEHENKKMRIMRSTREKKSSSSKGTKVLKCPNLDYDFNIKPFNLVHFSDHSHGFPLPLPPLLFPRRVGQSGTRTRHQPFWTR